MTAFPVLLVVEFEPKRPPDDCVLLELPNVLVDPPPPKSDPPPPVVFVEPNMPPLFNRITIYRLGIVLLKHKDIRVLLANFCHSKFVFVFVKK